ncbi:type VI secretion system contractile sheath small subunit [Colwellia sp. MB02u-10]|jgi:type VI secretion system protein ImpB|uniref:type VI secretion system contractile sheath small subunit n=1 Tax=Colwellia sp. MB02u-10 TaxID=2759828 RepID=UPI0015F42125|nr:type VI secretion system contractile sheath small subunit [Colwellia sp. MB02u-10]MBA6339745.1 type VI secretion system contractile sheath small subunit [Colwellia sp. MB02u-10]
MSKNKGGSVAPKERVNISYKPAVGDASVQIELPMKVLVMGDFMNRPDDRTIEERDLLNVNKKNFDEVMSSMDLDVTFSVPNRLTENSDEEIDIHLTPKCLKDFSPDNLVAQIPELKKVMELRAALKALKGPIGNIPKMRKSIQSMISDESIRERLIQEINPEK